MNSVERQLQFCLHKIQNFADDGFKFAKTKAACIHFVPNVNLTMIFVYIKMGIKSRS